MHRHGVEAGRHRRGEIGDAETGDTRDDGGANGHSDEVADKPQAYDIPLSYVNINEAEAPPPVQNPDELRVTSYRSLEENREEDAQLERDAQSQRRASDVSRKGRRRYGTAVPRPLVELYTVAYLIFFSFWGTLARLGLTSLTTYTGAPVSIGILWANFAGTAVLGFLAELAPLINRDHPADEEEQNEANKEDQHDSNRDVANVDPVNEVNGAPNNAAAVSSASPALPTAASPAAATAPAPIKRSKPIPLYVGLATGFCGSFTSFSSFMLEVFEALANTLPAPRYHPGDSDDSAQVASRSVGYDIMAPLAVLFLTVGMCLSALKLGAHLAIAGKHIARRVGPTSWARTHTTTLLRIADNAVVLLACGSWLAAVLLTVFQPGPAKANHWRTDVLFALVFAPLGCLLRFYLSLKLNGTFATFPLGTFAANILGTAVLAMAWDLQHASAVAATRLVGCQVLQGIMDGFCGCLTTVSTWMAELSGLRRRHAYVYGGISLATGLVVVVLVIGTPKWTIGWQEPIC
ncbi:uncharacterized protein SPSK_06228 [Sporothrix schenckii 1099-18]|uniref:Chromosome condensation protein (CrcB) n=1 Tax=Sporothrix schenckii 1099-18 TaxID=1397361 RepID=A0A0F2MKM2_SPOSC|nr:uncharacterized protein SPSK_06228 [Sporothrix schenckii 1099-18]KJR89604.1 hypothetical protein SPSK_06228 [Sporothrix schenckii 1099-18]